VVAPYHGVRGGGGEPDGGEAVADDRSEPEAAGSLVSGGRKKPLTQRGVAKMREREASVGVDAEDEAARWLAENDRPAPPKPPKSAKKSVTLHRFRQRGDRA